MAGNWYEKRPGVWRLRYRGKSRDVHTTSEREVQRKLARLITEVDGGDFKNTSKLTFKNFAEKWLKDYGEVELAPKTLFRYRQMLESRIYPALGSKRLGKIKPLDLLDFFNSMRKKHKYISIKNLGTAEEVREEKESKGLSEKTIKHHHSLVRSIYEKAIKWDVYKGENPAKRVDAPKVEKKKARVYDEAQTIKLLEALGKLEGSEFKYKVAVMLAIMTGARLGEIMGLEWQDVDFNKKVIEVRQASQYVPGEGIITKAPKTETSKRKISVNSALLDLLKEYQRDQREMGFLCQGNNRLFVQWNGEPMYTYTLTAWFPIFLQRNNLPPLNFHGLRHTSATFLISHGMDIQTVAGRLGHSTSATTQNIYSHFLESKDRQAADLMQDAFTIKNQNGAKVGQKVGQKSAPHDKK